MRHGISNSSSSENWSMSPKATSTSSALEKNHKMRMSSDGVSNVATLVEPEMHPSYRKFLEAAKFEDKKRQIAQKQQSQTDRTASTLLPRRESANAWLQSNGLAKKNFPLPVLHHAYPMQLPTDGIFWVHLLSGWFWASSPAWRQYRRNRRMHRAACPMPPLTRYSRAVQHFRETKHVIHFFLELALGRLRMHHRWPITLAQSRCFLSRIEVIASSPDFLYNFQTAVNITDPHTT